MSIEGDGEEVQEGQEEVQAQPAEEVTTTSYNFNSTLFLIPLSYIFVTDLFYASLPNKLV